ncbi:8342_t:CDS:1 [Paraglomus brasilianum]|uniref:8342_t:CDS:1 n=1 Tax=Paraglomus brasilianum TaxID=144538 RepID=A0A9N9CYF1_9GLOM|nr:8342_t:CDS:1 [Paraglomus brasilianum]
MHALSTLKIPRCYVTKEGDYISSDVRPSLVVDISADSILRTFKTKEEDLDRFYRAFLMVAVRPWTQVLTYAEHYFPSAKFTYEAPDVTFSIHKHEKCAPTSVKHYQ